MKSEFLEKVLIDIQYSVNKHNKELIDFVLSNSLQDIEYVWEKIPVLIKELKHVKGYVGLSNCKSKIKITYDNKNVSKEISLEFYEICSKWETKYNIKLEYDLDKEVFYIL